MYIKLAIFILLGILWGVFPEKGFASDLKTLSFKEALSLVFSRHPQTKVFEERRKALYARAEDASRLPNPEIEFSLEDVFGTGEFGGLRASETTFKFSQEIPLFGKRKKRKAAVLSRERILSHEESLLRLHLFRETAQAFTEVLYAEKKTELYRKLSELSRKLVKLVQAKFEAGKVPESEKIRAEIADAETGLKLRQALTELHTARQKLFGLWGASQEEGVKLTGNLFSTASLPSLSSLTWEKHPEVRKLKAEIEVLSAERDLARTEALPDVKTSFGVRRYNESDDTTYLFEVSLPLPIFNRNQGEIAALAREIAERRLHIRSLKLELNRELQELLGELKMTRKEIETLESKLLPQAEEIYRRNLEAYTYGKMDLLAVLDAQRTLFELRLGLLEAYRQYHLLRAEVLHLLAQPDPQFF